MEIKSLEKIDKNIIYDAFNEAFADYDVQINKSELKKMLQRRGFNPKLSFAIFENDRIIAFTLNGIGYFNNKKTAYDTGTGTLKEYRGRGLATKIFNYSLPYLKENGIKQYLLEVLQHNKKAISVYRNLGFKTNREFNYFIQNNINIKNTTKNIYTIKNIDINDDIDNIYDFIDYNPSWQNCNDAILRNPKDFIFLGAYNNEELIGYIVLEPSSGDITQIGVKKNFRRKGIASYLLKEATKLNKHKEIKIINTDIKCLSITNFLESKNIMLKGKQFEMIKEI